MAWSSSDRSSRQRFRIEFWSWATWLVLAVVSYPAVVLIWTAPRAGLAGGLAVGLFLLFAASLGYAERSELNRWFWPAGSGLAVASMVAVLAFASDGTTLGTALFCGFTVACEIIFIWHFLPWIVRDADVPSGHTGLQFVPRGARSPVRVRAALGLVLLLAFLLFGLGAVWSRGEKGVPAPTAWLIALALVSFTLMFVERMSFFEHSARHGNLVMAAGCYRTWIGNGLALLVLAAILAAALPWRPSPKRNDTARVGSATVETPALPAPRTSGLREALDQAAAAVKQVATAALAAPRAIFALWLLLLLLLLALVLVWGFRRSRAAKRLVWLLRWMLSAAARVWRRFIAALAHFLPAPDSAPVEKPAAGREEPADPLFDFFEDTEALAALSPREVVIRTYHLLLNFAEMLGHGRRLGQTPFEYAEQLQQEVPAAAESLLALTWAYAGAMYGGDRAVLPEPSAVRRAWDRVSAALTTGASPEHILLRRRAYLATRALDDTG